MRELFTREFRSLTRAAGPLLFLDRAGGLAFGEVVDVVLGSGERRRGQVLEVHREHAVIEVLTGTRGIGLEETTIAAHGEPARIGVGPELLGRQLDGSGRPLDGGPPPLPVAYWDVHGMPINPVARANPSECIETGVTAIDLLNTLVRGQKLPIFSAFGLPAGELAARIAAHAHVGEDFVVVFAALGVPHREASFFSSFLEQSGQLERTVLFLNLADDPAIERLLTPRLALTTAEYFAYEQHRHVLVILSDMTNYCEALREVATAREEVPGRRGYPGYMYTDLAQIYERAGRWRGRAGSVTQLVILSMPDDDITHPIPDLTGYITEGQIVLSRALAGRGVDPPIDVLPSLSRQMQGSIGDEQRAVAAQLYSFYAEGRDLRRLVAIIGEASLTEEDTRLLRFAERFERELVGQPEGRRSLSESMDKAWELLSDFPPEALKRIPRALLSERS
ncbi:MAG: V-type ATP synthase subunit B [Planctomycetota bacterium]|jgi:V/A-type H+-transporting ATPase subunit B